MTTSVEAESCEPRRSPAGERWTLERIVTDYIEHKRPNLAKFLRF